LIPDGDSLTIKKKEASMNSNQILTGLALVVALLATFMADAFAHWTLVLVALGLVNGFINPFGDMSTRMAYTVAAVAIPPLANGLDAIPVVGAPINGIIDQLMVAVGAGVIANFILVLKDQLMPSGD
jgi:hypothetical protein